MTRLNTDSFNLLQITDTHLGKHEGDTLLGLNTDESFRDVLSHIRDSQQRFDLIVASGDISCDGSVESYERFIALVREYLPGVPLAWLEGNHDEPSGMQGVPSPQQPLSQLVTLGDWRIILLNSRVEGEVGGELAESELARLEGCLNDAAGKPSLVFLHHQPVDIGCVWLDQYVVKNADEVFSCIDRHSNVKAVCWGHIHQVFEQSRKKTQLLSTPSTCIQFAPNSVNFALDKKMPGYRTFVLHQNGHLETSVERIPDKTYPIDFSSSGY